MKKIVLAALAALLSFNVLAVTSSDSGQGVEVKTFVLNNETITLTHAAATTNAYGSITLGKLPEGLIAIHGAVLELGGVMAGFGTNTTTVSASVGTVAATGASLTGTVANVIASASAVGWTNRSAKVRGVTTDSATVDGTATAPTLYLNVVCPVSLTNGTLSGNGKVRLIYSNAGDTN